MPTTPALDIPAPSRSRLVIPPEMSSVGTLVRSLEETAGLGDHVLMTPRLDFDIVNRALKSTSVSVIVIETQDFSDHARKMLQEAGIALVVDEETARAELARRCLVDQRGLTLLNDGVPVSAICSVLNARNVGAYRRFGITALGYFRFKFCLFQLFAEEPGAYVDARRIEEYLLQRLIELGEQHWTSIRCVLSDPTSAELGEVGIEVPMEVNPDLGLRGPRVMKRWRAELAAIRRFREMYDIAIEICAPFIASIDEYQAFVSAVEEAGIDRGSVALGFTLEVPMLAESLDELFAENRVDFMGIGTSDLFALYNAVDRNNHALKVPTDSPGNIKLLRRIVPRANAHGVRTFVCGEIRRNERLMTELIALGVNELICSPRIEEMSTVMRLSSASSPIGAVMA